MATRINWLQKCYISPERKNKRSVDITWSSSDSSDNEALYFNPSKKLCTYNQNGEFIINTTLTPEFNLNKEDESINDAKLSTRDPIEGAKNTSPVIKNRKLIKKKRKKYKINLEKTNISADLFSSYSRIILDSPEQINDTEITISPERTDLPQGTMCIQTFPSQLISQVQDSWVPEKTKDHSIFCQPLPFKRRKTRPKGLALQLDKVLKLQKTRLSFWDYELNFNGVKSQEVSDEESIVVFVKKQWEEYGRTLYECEKDSFESFVNTKETILLIFNTDLINASLLEANYKYKLYPPFSIHQVFYRNCEMKCLFNLSKYVACK